MKIREKTRISGHWVEAIPPNEVDSHTLARSLLVCLSALLIFCTPGSAPPSIREFASFWRFIEDLLPGLEVADVFS